jgi:hypothetical protein
MPICPLCDDTGLQNSDSTNPDFCYCSAGKRARRQWEVEHSGARNKGPASFIDVSNLEQVNAGVDAMRASLLGSTQAETSSVSSNKHSAVQLLYRVSHAGHEVTMAEATQLYDLAKALEGFLGDIALIGRKKK